jgi:hypothetical protein
MLYVDIPTLPEFRGLAVTRGDACVSIFLPTTPLTQESAASRTEPKNLSGAATFGAVEQLLVDIDAVLPGTVDDADGRVTFGDGRPEQTYGVVDEIAKRALLTGARVLGVREDDIPGRAHLAATLRYPN